MHTHATFSEIVLHSDDELADRLGAGISSRKTIHCWPLSCVQELVLEDGRELIYKSQLPPTVEPLFYQTARSGLLPAFEYLGKFGRSDIMILDKIQAPLLSSMKVTDNQLLQHGKRIMHSISEISHEVPVYLDIGSESAWLNQLKILLKKLRILIHERRFRNIDIHVLEILRTWAATDRVVKSITDHSGLIHGDLKADQIFLTPEGYRIIDWQRPMMAPSEVDLVSLLVEQGLNPRLHLDTSVVNIFWFLRLHWAVSAQYDLFPDKRWPLFNTWAIKALSEITN